MKKTIIIIISLIYIASIVIVNFFGLQVKQFDGVTYVQSINIAEVRLLLENPIIIDPMYYDIEGLEEVPWYEFQFIPPSDGKEYSIDDLENIQTNPNAIHIDYEILPHDANERSIEFIYDKEAYKDSVYYNELKNTFVFLQPNIDLEIIIKSRDGSLTETKLYICSIDY